MAASVTLREITDENRDDVLALRVAPEQHRFVGSVAGALEDAEEYPEGKAWYRAVYDGEEPVGFVMLSWDVTPVPGVIIGPWFLWKLLIDERHQRRGYGRAALRQVVEIVRNAGATELLTSYTTGEGEPWPFYERFGFVPTGDRDAAGEIILSLDLSRTHTGVIYQHPLAYLLGLEGIALLRAFSGAYDRDFTLARLREIQSLLDSAEELGAGVEARPITTHEAYDRWAPFYGEPGNQLLEIEQPIVREILDRLPVGVAPDAACGTGRHTAYLASLGHKVIGVDTSPEMLARARDKVPEGEFYQADLHDVPLPDNSVDLVVCAIALSHVPNLARALAEFVRVLRPNGHLVISDSRGLIADIGLPLVRIGPDGEVGYMPTWSRLASDYLAAALPLGLQVRRCEEPRRPSPLVGDDGTDLYDGVRPPDHVSGNPPNIWSLHARDTAATNAAWRGNPAAIIWLFELPAD